MNYNLNSIIKYTLSAVFSICLFIIILISSVQIAVYWDMERYFKNEYVKYNVAENISMDINDIMYVTYEMMDYLDNKREDLVVYTYVDGEEREFFNEREKQHMIDVKNLFTAGKNLRIFAFVIGVISLGIIAFKYKNIKTILSKGFVSVSTVIICISIILICIIQTDFTKYFTIFHEIFFNNDLWLLNPKTDLLINIVPEPFFIDTAIRIAVIFGLMMAVCFILSVVIILIDRKRRIL